MPEILTNQGGWEGRMPMQQKEKDYNEASNL